MRLVILGAPGSGKRTQASLLATTFGLTTLTTTELVKAAMSEESEQGLQLRLLQEAGQAVTEDIILSLLQTRLRLPDVQDGFILDGFPRNLLQALTLDEMLTEIGQPIDYVLLIHIETDTLMERLVGRRTCRSCGATYNIYTHPTVVEDVCDACGGRLHRRYDDNEETVSNRLHVFDHLTSQLLSHYGKQGKVLRVDGDGEADEVFARVREALDAAVNQPKVEPVPAASAETPAVEPTPSTKQADVEQPAAPVAGKKKPQVPAKQATPLQRASRQDAKESSKKEGSGKQPKKGAAKSSAGQSAIKSTSKAVAKSAGRGAQVRQKQGGSAAVAATKPKAQTKKKQTAVPVAKKQQAKRAVGQGVGTGSPQKAKQPVKKSGTKTKQPAPTKPKTKAVAAKKGIRKSQPKQSAAKKKVAKKSPVKAAAVMKPSSPKSKLSAAGAKKKQSVGKASAKKKAVLTKAATKGTVKAAEKAVKKRAKASPKKATKKVAKKTTSRPRR